MTDTRRRILELLQKESSFSVEKLATDIGLAAATIRRHLDILQRDGLVTFTEVRKGTGRPKYSFFLTEKGQEALPKGYAKLLGLVAQELTFLTAEDTKTLNGEQILLSVLRRLAKRVYAEGDAAANNKNLNYRLEVLLRLLQEEDFSPDATVAEGVLQIRLLNCPYRSVALRNKTICSFDSSLISVALNHDTKLQERIQDGDSCCVYSIQVTAKKRLNFPRPEIRQKGIIPSVKKSFLGRCNTGPSG